LSSFDRETAQKLDAWGQSHAGRRALGFEQAFIGRLLRPRSGERLLDVGCGAGFQLESFRGGGLAVTGLDPSPAMLDLARIRLGGGPELIPGRAEDLPFEDNAFDVVTMIHCLEHVDDPLAALAEAARVARERVFVAVTNRWSLAAMSWAVKNFARRDRCRPRRYYSPWELARLWRRAVGTPPARIRTLGLLPPRFLGWTQGMENVPLLWRNPFGHFIGMVAYLTYPFRPRPLILPVRIKLGPARVSATPTPTGRVVAGRKGDTGGADRPATWGWNP
jgi:ubiquinone/menaquinone biosynthesis C-methylase UbiE